MVEGFGRHWYGRGEQDAAPYDDDTAVATLTRLWARGLGLTIDRSESTEAMYHRTPEHEQFRKAVRDLVEKEINPHVDEWEEAGHLPRARAVPEARGDRRARPRVRRGVRRPGRRPLVHRRARRGARPRRLRRRAHGDRRAGGDGHAGARPLRQPRAEEGLPRARAARRDGLLDRGVRARRRQRRRRHPHARRPRRRRLGHQRPQDVDHQRHPGRLAVPARAHERRGRLPGHVA